MRCEWERECALVCQDYGGFLATKRKSPSSSLLLLLLLLLFAQAPTATPIFLHVPFLWVQILSAQLEFEWISSCFVDTHAHTGTHRHEPHSHQVDIVSSSSSLLSLARRFHLINCVYKKEMNCHAQQQQQQQLVVYACVCVRASNGWRSFGAALNHIGCASVCFTVCVCLAYTSVPVCVSVFVCMWAFSSLAFLRARTQFSSRLSCPSSLTLKYAFLCVRVCERVRSSGIGSFQMQFRLPWAFRLIIKLPLPLPPPLLLFLFFSYFFFSFFFSVFLLLLFAWWVETSQRSLLRPVGLSHSLTPSFSPCLCLCVSSCAWADLNFMVSSILPSCNIKLN